MSFVEKSTFALAAIAFSIWFFSLFWPTTSAEIRSVNKLSFGTGGYPAQRLGHTYQGKGGFDLYLATYRYSLSGMKYEGKGIVKLTRLKTTEYAPVKISYFSSFPALSFSSKHLLLYSALSLIFIGLGFMQIRLFIKKWLQATHP